KLHNLLHYGDLIKFYDPLVLFSTLKYETKHLEFKNYYEVTNNRLNLAFSSILGFARQHQMRVALYFADGKFASTNFFAKDPYEKHALFLQIQYPKAEGYTKMLKGNYPCSIKNNIIFFLLVMAFPPSCGFDL